MEPADQRRDDLHPIMVPAQNQLPQWSPPINGGMTPFRLQYNQARRSLPQWSPPINGGMTEVRERPLRRRAGAAMEPADQRRDDLLAVRVVLTRGVAAMEPADQRR